MELAKATQLFVFAFGPLFAKGRWFLWVLAFLALMMQGNSITAIRMEIPSREQVIKLRGTFLDTSKGYFSKSGLYSIGVVDELGTTYRCNCELLGNSNCLGRRSTDHSDIKDQLDAEIVSRYGVHKAMLKWLDGKPGELWMYPNNSLFGSEFSCYQLADDTRVYRSFEQSVEEYAKAKRQLGVYLIWFLAALGSLVLSIFVIYRVRMFLKGSANG